MLLGCGCGNWHNSEQLLDDAAYLADDVALHWQNLLYCEEELNVAKAPQRTLAESQVVTAKANLQMHQGLLPLRQQYYFMRQMAKTLWHSPFSRLQACSWPTKHLPTSLKQISLHYESFDVLFKHVIRFTRGIWPSYPRANRYPSSETSTRAFGWN